MEVAVLFTTDEVDWLWFTQICCCPDVFAVGAPEDEELEPALSICCMKEEDSDNILCNFTDDSAINTRIEYLEIEKAKLCFSITKKKEIYKHLSKSPYTTIHNNMIHREWRLLKAEIT